MATEQLDSTANVSASEASGHPVHFADATMNSAVDAGLSEGFVSATPANSLSTGKRTETALLDERALLACIVRTIPAGGKIHISSTVSMLHCQLPLYLFKSSGKFGPDGWVTGGGVAAAK